MLIRNSPNKYAFEPDESFVMADPLTDDVDLDASPNPYADVAGDVVQDSDVHDA